MQSQKTGILCAILSSILSSIAWIFQGEATRLLTPMVFASAQSLLTGLIYLAHLKISRLTFPIEIIKRHRKDLIEYILLRGIIGNILICYALFMSESIKVMFLTKLEPYFIIFWVWFLQRKTISRAHASLLVVHICGAILLSTGGEVSLSIGHWGDLMLITAIALFAYCYLHAARLAKELGPIHLNGISSACSGIALLPIALVVAPLAAWTPSNPGWINLIIVVLLFDVFALTLWYHALNSVEGWLVSALRAIGPVCAAPFAWYFFGQNLSLIQIAGAALVIVTSALLARDKKTKQAIEPEVI